MEIVFAGSLPKEKIFPEDNEDLIFVSDDLRRIVVCDGASESFDSKTWSRVIKDNFIHSNEISVSWIEDALRIYNSQFDFPIMSWSRQAAFERGSFTTLLGVNFSQDYSQAKLTAIGDSVVFLLCKGQLVASFPYHYSDQFRERPTLLSTKRSANAFDLEFKLVGLSTAEWEIIPSEDVIMLFMTDALGQWALKSHEDGIPKWSELCRIRNDAELSALIDRERESHSMRTDDVSLLHLRLTSSDYYELSDT